MTKKVARILSIDGGGIRGLIPASILQSLEKEIGPVAKRFHMVAGTSTGGIIASALCCPGQCVPAADLVKFYRNEGPNIFSNTFGAVEGLLGEVYSAEPLMKALKAVLHGKLSEVNEADLLITAYELQKRIPRIFKNWKALGVEDGGPEDDFQLTDVARCTSAAPTFFPPALVKNSAGKSFVMVDGGVYANNPAMCAYVAARKLYPYADEYLILSLGTGELVKPYTYDEAKSWGIVGWARPLLDIMFSGVSDTITYELDQLRPQVRQFRIQSSLKHASEDMDNVTPENLDALVKTGADTYKAKSKEFGELIQLLKEPMLSRTALGYPQRIGLPKSSNAPVPKAPPSLKSIKKKGQKEVPIAGPFSLGGAVAGAATGSAAGIPGAIVGGVVGFITGKKLEG